MHVYTCMKSKPFTLTSACVRDWFTTFGHQWLNTSVPPVIRCSFRHGMAGWLIFISYESDRCCTGAPLLCLCVRVVWHGRLCAHTNTLSLSACAASPSIPKGPPVLCIVWPSGAVHFASANRIDPRPTSDRQQANGSGFLPAARDRERWEDITWGMRERERESGL